MRSLWITYCEVDEDLTSQTCSCCGRVRKANRKYRGLYACDQCHTKQNADINAAKNIIRKVDPHAFSIGGGSSGGVNPPERIRLVV